MEGTALRLLINGEIVASGTAAGAVPALGDVSLGVGVAYLAGGGTNFPSFSGYGRQFRAWTTARSAVQIAASAGAALPAERTGLFAAWPLDESSGSGARDSSGNNRPLLGGGAAQRLAVLEAGPFFAVT